MNAIAALRKVSYVDRNADPGSGRHDYQNSALSELRGKAFVPIACLCSSSSSSSSRSENSDERNLIVTMLHS